MTIVYVVLIPFINWSFTWAPMWEVLPGWAFNPVTIVTGLVLVVRDFAQREIGHYVLIAMAIALILTAFAAGPELALASGGAFAIAELVDWALFQRGCYYPPRWPRPWTRRYFFTAQK